MEKKCNKCKTIIWWSYGGLCWDCWAFLKERTTTKPTAPCRELPFSDGTDASPEPFAHTRERISE